MAHRVLQELQHLRPLILEHLAVKGSDHTIGVTFYSPQLIDQPLGHSL